MKVILLTDVPSLGKKGEEKEVADGYANNFLFPKKMAQPSTKGAVRMIEQKKKSEQARIATERTKAQQRAKTLEQIVVPIRAKAGEQGKLFGSITTKHVAEALASQGFDVDKRNVLLEDAIRSLGETTVRIKLFQDVIAHVRVRIEKS